MSVIKSFEGAAAIVLAGGRSSRMGQPKALLPFSGETLIARVVRTLKASFGEIVVVAAADQELPDLPVTLVRDQTPYQGPVGGMCYGLRVVSGDPCFITSCDAPFLNLQIIETILAALENVDVAVPMWQGRLQPLHAIYRKRVQTVLEKQFAEGQLRPTDLYGKVATRIIAEEELRKLDPEGLSFLNLNTPRDYQTALKRGLVPRKTHRTI
jgi:molybdopterin-guanine dinucleotide biosynthesis protein A